MVRVMLSEERALVLDYLGQGRSSSFRAEPLAQLLGTQFFTLLEIIPKENIALRAQQEVYIGKDERPEVDHIKRRLKFEELTNTAVTELEVAIETIIKKDEARFLKFFNSSGAVSIRMHQLELLPGIGKKHVQDILAERQKEPFDSFTAIEERIKLMTNPVESLKKRIIDEIKGTEKYYLFARPPMKEDYQQGQGYRGRR